MNKRRSTRYARYAAEFYNRSLVASDTTTRDRLREWADYYWELADQ